MHEDGKLVTESILNFLLEVIRLLTGEDYIVLKKPGDCDSLDSLALEGLLRTQSPRTESPHHTLIHEIKNNELKILELTNAIIQLLTGEVPVRCEDVTVYLSMEEWEYLEGHKDRYKDVMMNDLQPLATPAEIQSTRNPFLKTQIPLLQRTVLTSKDWSLMGQSMLHLTQEIMRLLSRQGYVILRNFDENITHSSGPVVAEEKNKIQSPGSVPPPHSQIHLKKNDKKILALTNAIIQLLMGEVPLRCEDVTVYFSIEEWEYLERHKDLYKELMMECRQAEGVMLEGRQSLIISDASNCNHTASVPITVTACGLIPREGTGQGEKCYDFNVTGQRQRLCGRNGLEELPSCEQAELIDHFSSIELTQTESVSLVKEESVSREDCIPVLIKEELDSWAGGDLPDISNNSVPAKYPCPAPENTSDEDVMLTHTPAEHAQGDYISHPYGEEFTPCKQTLSDTTEHVRGRSKVLPCSECSKKCAGKAAYTSHQKIHVVERMFSCTNCEKYFSAPSDVSDQVAPHKENNWTCSVCKVRCTCVSNLLRHYCIHLDKEVTPCSECRRNYIGKHKPVAPDKVRKPVSCSVCGKVFEKHSTLIIHQRTHTGEKPFSCPDCDKCFTSKGSLFTHQMSHTGFMRFPCSECGKCFKYKSRLLEHQQTHTGKKPFSCPDCGKAFTRKSTLLHHQFVHTGELKFACSVCSLRFAYRSVLVTHEKTHTGEKPFFCSLCGERFTRKSSLVTHHHFHIGKKPFSCSHCERRFTSKSSLKYHENTHAREKPPVLNVANVVLVGQIMFL